METKKEFKWFTIFDYEKEQDYLRQMHKSGWRFVEVKGVGMYHFVKCEPEDVIYQLDYNKEGLSNKEEYLQMFQDCGWEHLQEYAGYSYFRKPVNNMDGEEEIFCDNDSKIQMMERVLKGRMLPLVMILTCVLLPQFILNVCSMHNYFVATMIGIVIGLYLVVFAGCAMKYRKYKENSRE